jgi:hypothetical protein
VISVQNNRELKAVVLGLKQVSRSFRSDMNKATRTTMTPVWKQVVSANASGTSSFVSRMLNNNVRVKAGNPPVLMAAGSKRGIGKRKDLTPGEHFYLAEFGGRSQTTSTYTRKSKNGGRHQVTRRTRTGLPPRVPGGRVVYPAAAEWIPRATSLWVQLFMRQVYDAVEGR